MKTCIKCHQVKSIGDYYSTSNRCKECCKAYTKIRSSIVRATPDGKARRAWDNMLWRCRHDFSYKDVKIVFTRDAFLSWAIPAYKKFMNDNPGVKPSLDRIDSQGNYELGNVQVLGIDENWRKKKTPQPFKVRKTPLEKVVYKIKKMCHKENIDINLLLNELRSTR